MVLMVPKPASNQMKLIACQRFHMYISFHSHIIQKEICISLGKYWTQELTLELCVLASKTAVLICKANQTRGS